MQMNQMQLECKLSAFNVILIPAWNVQVLSFFIFDDFFIRKAFYQFCFLPHFENLKGLSEKSWRLSWNWMPFQHLLKQTIKFESRAYYYWLGTLRMILGLFITFFTPFFMSNPWIYLIIHCITVVSLDLLDDPLKNRGILGQSIG